MPKITQKQLISQLKELKEIKPRQEWVSLLKSQIIVEKQPEVAIKENPAQFAGFANIMDLFSSTVFQKRLAYSLATLAIMIVGVLGFINITKPVEVKQVAVQSQASLLGQQQIALKQNVANLTSKVNSLAQTAKNSKTASAPLALKDINTSVKNLVADLKNNQTNDPETLKEIAGSLKTLADVSGTDLTKNPDVNDLYQTVVENQITDLQKTTLTDNQKIILIKAQDLYKEGKYADALEQILLINQ